MVILLGVRPTLVTGPLEPLLAEQVLARIEPERSIEAIDRAGSIGVPPVRIETGTFARTNLTLADTAPRIGATDGSDH
ncbi:MAG: hypothetical protein IID33_14620 [Planctomycetes bacterium]|nr:hypothetical protein [Planctomycetota bacterium]